MVSKGLQKIIDDLRDEGIVINGDGYEFPEGFPLQTRLKDVLEKDVDLKYYLKDTAKFFIKNSFDMEAKGNGFRFSPHVADNANIGKCITTRAGSRMDDNFIIDVDSDLENFEFSSKNDKIEPLLIKEATKKGYAEAYDGDSVNLEQPNSQTRRGRVGTQIANTLMTSCAQGVVEGYRIRKLTPKECWTLMNFDEDAFDKASPYISDSALYKQAGNSIVVACMEHIFNNLDIDKIKGGNIWNIESQLTSAKTKENIG